MAARVNNVAKQHQATRAPRVNDMRMAWPLPQQRFAVAKQSWRQPFSISGEEGAGDGRKQKA